MAHYGETNVEIIVTQMFLLINQPSFPDNYSKVSIFPDSKLKNFFHSHFLRCGNPVIFPTLTRIFVITFQQLTTLMNVSQFFHNCLP